MTANKSLKDENKIKDKKDEKYANNVLTNAPKGKRIFGTVTISDRGQVVIPKEARNLFRLKAGDKLLVLGDESSHGIALVKAEDFMDTLNEVMKLNLNQSKV